MRSFIFCKAFLILLGFSLNSGAGVSDWFVVLDTTNGFYASPGVPEAAITALKASQKENYEIKSFAFTPTGDWIVLNDKSFEISDTEQEMYKNLHETYQRNELGKNINCVAITPAGSYINCYRRGLWGGGGNPSGAWNKYKDLCGSGHNLRSLSYGPKDSWVILYDKTNISFDGIPDDLAKVLDSAVSNNVPIECVAFSGTNWICLAHDDWWASDTNLPAAKIIDQNYKAGQHPKWVAFVPNLGPFNARKFGTIIRQTMAGKLAGGYACEVIDHGKVVVALAEGWARAPWEKKDPSIPWTINTKQDVASTSKTITATALLKLWEETSGTSRQFSLDEAFWPHISRVCPNVNEDIKKITIRQVLTHRSGLDKHGPDDLKKLLLLPLAHPPGTVSEYQNVNYYIIRLLIEQISQEDYTAYVKTHVLAPMGIMDMETHNEQQLQTCAYDKPGSQKSGDPGYVERASLAGPGGWFASAADLGKFLEGLRHCRVLNSATTAMMLKEKLGWDWGGGIWMKGGLTFGPNGGPRHSIIAYFPDEIEAVLIVNCDDPPNDMPWFAQAWKDARY